MIGLVIEEITEEEETASSENCDRSTAKYSVSPPQETSGSSTSQSGINIESPSTNAECVQALKDDPEAIRFVCLHERIVKICFCLHLSCKSVYRLLYFISSVTDSHDTESADFWILLEFINVVLLSFYC